MSLLATPIQEQRFQLSAHFLKGHGVEIGALHSPLWVGRKAHVTYVDRMSADDLRTQYPELALYELAKVDVIDDGERLTTFPDESLDFIIANHMLEHCENPLGTIRRHLAKLKVGGRLYYAVPDKRFCHDATRPLTDFNHLVRDDREGPEWSRRDHFLEWATMVEKAQKPSHAEQRASLLMSMNYSIHFHVWDAERFGSIIDQAYEYLGRTFSTDWLEQNGTEVIAVLTKSLPTLATSPAKRLRANSLAWRLASGIRRLQFMLGWGDFSSAGLTTTSASTGRLTVPMRYCVDLPKAETLPGDASCRFAGWVISATKDPVIVRVRRGDCVFESSTHVHRPDVVTAFGGEEQVPNALCGFSFDCDLGSLGDSASVSLEFDNGITLVRAGTYTVGPAATVLGRSLN